MRFGGLGLRLGGRKREHPVVGGSRVGGHLAAKALPARALEHVGALERLRDFHGKRLLADSRSTVNDDRLREAVLAQRRHQADALAFLRRGTI